jgi:hypothetical protein
MPLRFRAYLLEENGTLKRIPRRVSDGLVFGNDAIPEYANSRQKVVDVYVENEDGKPVRILDARGSYFEFDKEGRIDRTLGRRAWELVELGHQAERAARAKVVDIRPGIEQKKWLETHRWEITAEILHRIAADLWPDKEVPQLAAVKGKAPKRPPLTSDARNAIDELWGKIGSIESLVEDLSEVALKGFAFEARRISSSFSDGRELWDTIATLADKAREIKARHRTGRGEWFAVLNVWEEVDPREQRALDTVEVRCKTRKEAVLAAQQLLRDNAHRFSDRTTIEAEIHSELDWKSVGNGPEHELPSPATV